MRHILVGIFALGYLATFAQLTFFDDVRWNWWNWLVIIPINAFLSSIWPVYWAIIKPLFG